MGHFGAQTGYPVLNVTVTNNDGMKTDKSKDYIVMGTVDDQPALGKLNKNLPVQVDNGNLHIQDTQGFFAPLSHAWWKVRSSDHIQSGQLETAGGLPDALIEGIEWPSGSSKSVVLIAVRDHSVVPKFINVFLKYSQYSDIFAVGGCAARRPFHFLPDRQQRLPRGFAVAVDQLTMLFSEFPGLVVISTVVVCILMAALIRAYLRRRARMRLQGSD